MAEYVNSQEIKRAVLRTAGELTTGTSQYDALALQHLNRLYRDLFVGGNEFGIDTAESWVWAKSERPIILTLQPAYETGMVTLTSGSHAGTFSSAPTVSLEGWFIKLSARSEYFKIVAHEAGYAGFSIDQAYTEDSGSLEFRAIKLDYDLVDDVIIINDYNKSLPFRSNSGSFSPTLTKGVYTPTTFAAHVVTTMQTANNVGTYAAVFNRQTRKFTVSHNSMNIGFLFGAGSSGLDCSKELGMDKADQSVALSQTSTYALNGIQRLIGPMQVHRNNGETMDQKGKILGVDFNTMIRKHPLVDVYEGIPTHFAEVQQRPNGIMTVRFNAYPAEDTRVEIEHIPVAQELQDNTTSVPLVPISYRDYLVFGAVYYVMCEKKDDQAAAYGDLATKKLTAMVNHTRKKAIQTGANFGRLIPRG